MRDDDNTILKIFLKRILKNNKPLFSHDEITSPIRAINTRKCSKNDSSSDRKISLNIGNNKLYCLKAT